jgi:hypothetical protein
MITEQTQPLTIARTILAQSTLQAVARAPYNLQGWRILDRWAFNSPQKLLQLEQQGEILLLARLLEQQKIEVPVLTSPEALAQKEEGVAEHEILEMNLVNTEL